jgi:hypothetical protein
MLLLAPFTLTLLALLRLTFANNDSATTEAMLLWPLEGETFSLNSKGMGVIFALQNYPEAQRHGWSFSWDMCAPEPDVKDRRNCAFYEANYDKTPGSNDPNAPTVLRNGEDDGDVHIELNHSFWYNNGEAYSLFNSSISGVYSFEWRFSIGNHCYINNSEPTNPLDWSDRRSFDVTIDATAAPYPTMTTATCASPLVAVSYTESVPDRTFTHSVDIDWTCMATVSVTKSPEPCRATLDAAQIGIARSVMGWDQAVVTGTPTPSGAAQVTNAAGTIKVDVVVVCFLYAAVNFIVQ